jgi:hypothetical protein
MPPVFCSCRRQLTDLQLHTVLRYAARDFDPCRASGNSKPMGDARPAAQSRRRTYGRTEEAQ